MPSDAAALNACAQMVERGDPDRFAAAMTAPLGARARLWPLYAFNLEVARAPWVTTEPIIAEMRLQFWRDVLEETETGKPPRAHEVAAPLRALHTEAALPLAPLREMIDARRVDIARDAFATPDALWSYLQQTSGALMWASVAVLGGGDEPAARALGTAQGLANWLMAQPALREAGWQASDDTLLEPLLDHALSALKAGSSLDFRAAAPAARAAWRAQGILTRAKATPAAIAQGTLGGSEFARRTSLMWRTIRGR